MTGTSDRKYELTGKLAFAAVVVAVFAESLRSQRVTGEPWQVVLVFCMGAIYVALGVVGLDVRRPQTSRSIALYFVIQCALATAIVAVTPIKGFSALVTMPIASMAVLELDWRWAALVVVELFVTVVATLWISFGAESAVQAIPGYGSAFIFVIVFSLVTRHAREARRRAEQLSGELAAANEQLRQHAAQASELATTRERNRLAREIHDGLGHYLTTINVQLEAARAVLAREPARAADALDTASRLSREALEDVRHSVGTLRADAPRPPLPDTLQSMARNLGVPVTVAVRGESRPLAPAVEHALYRSAQEGLTNVLKHAAANRTDLVLDFRDAGRVVLTVTDDGRGPGVDAATGTTGFGLRGIRERIDLLGGTVTTGAADRGGFALTVDVPA